MQFYISGGVLVCLEYPNKHSRLHQGLGFIIYVIALILIVLKMETQTTSSL